MPEPKSDPRHAARLEDAFEPIPWLRGPTRQTILGTLLPARYPATLPPYERQEVSVPGPERLGALVTPQRGRVRGRLLLLHGLGGSATSRYMLRVVGAAWHRGWEVARLHFRGAERDRPATPSFHNAQRTEDIQAALEQIRWTPQAAGTPLCAAGFSLGGAILMRYLCEHGASNPVVAAAAVNPPVDLAACLAELEAPRNRIYHSYYVARMRRQIRPKIGAHPRRLAPLTWSIDTLRKLDAFYTAPDAGYPDPEAYYAGASVLPMLGALTTPCFVLSANDDPFVPARLFDALPPTKAPLELMMTRRGGHVGYLANGEGGLSFWAAGAVLDWLESRIAM